jgi:CheY-like chemotaxis protein
MKSALFVSADPDHRDLYVPVLRRAGYRVSVVSDVSHAADRLRRLPADAVIMHLERDDERAWKECGLLVETARPAPVVLITSWVRPDAANVRRCMSIDCAAFVAEPCVPSDLVAIVQRVLTGERQLEWPFTRLA